MSFIQRRHRWGSLQWRDRYCPDSLHRQRKNLTYCPGIYKKNHIAPRNAFSLSAMKRFCAFRRKQETMMEKCILKDDESMVTKVPCYYSNWIKWTSKYSKWKQATTSVVRHRYVSSLKYQAIIWRWQKHCRRHISVNFETIIKMAKKGIIEGVPQIDKSIPMICRTCFQHNRKRIPRNPTDNTHPPLMLRFSIDFMFYSHISLRGHNSAFTIVD